MNPLLEKLDTPFETVPFNRVHNEDILPALQMALENGRQEIEQIRKNPAEPTFENTLEALERSGSSVGLVARVLYNLNAAETNEEIQKIARESSPLLSDYANDVLLDETLFQRIRAVYEQKDELTLRPKRIRC